MALQFDLLPESLRPLSPTSGQCNRSSRQSLTTGFHATIMAMQQLCRTGYCDLAYRLIESRRFLSDLFHRQGATTIWDAGRLCRRSGFSVQHHEKLQPLCFLAQSASG
jgi:alpha-L-rhamnosidase